MKNVVIDVREPYEYEIDHVKESINIPLGHLANNPLAVDDVPKNANVIVYCHSGMRAEQAKTILQNLGYKNVTNGINPDEVREKFGL